MKHAGKEELIDAIRSVIDGRSYLSSRFPLDLVSILSEAVRRTDTGRPKLTKRQREVLQLVAEGRTMKEVAVALSISTRTAEAYKYEIMRLLGLHNSTELVHYAIRIGLLTIPRMQVAA
jgi:DNA-binding NarL/FixJ family response regulator